MNITGSLSVSSFCTTVCPSVCHYDPCNYFNIDNIVPEPVTGTLTSIAPVPLPAGFPLMASALAGLSLFRRKKFK
ncbi:MAG: VPLPA-CTERM sorting domain-containing protein [Methylococcales bacterium]|nr:VPLPA-CTERM sorting domain-containing protein [Methylococcales bacterium]